MKLVQEKEQHVMKGALENAQQLWAWRIRPGQTWAYLHAETSKTTRTNPDGFTIYYQNWPLPGDVQALGQVLEGYRWLRRDLPLPATVWHAAYLCDPEYAVGFQHVIGRCRRACLESLNDEMTPDSNPDRL